MKAAFNKFGPKHDYRGAHVTLEYRGCTLLGEIKDVTRDEITGCVRARVHHFNGEAWPIHAPLRTLEILERA